LQLAGTAGGDQDVAIIAVEAFDQFHRSLPLAIETQDLVANSVSFVLSQGSHELLHHFPTKFKFVRPPPLN
jgi:hypothetical protein